MREAVSVSETVQPSDYMNAPASARDLGFDKTARQSMSRVAMKSL